MNETTTAQPPCFSVAGVLLEGIAARDFGRLRAALHPDATMRALLPRRFAEWEGADDVCGAFAGWFGDLASYELLDASIGEVGARLHLRWRARVRAGRLGDGAFVIEQQVYADAEDDRVSRLSLLCSGFCPEHSCPDHSCPDHGCPDHLRSAS